jgi:PAS domain S-box-containing protein
MTETTKHRGLLSAFTSGNTDSWQDELVRFSFFAVLGTAASYFSVNIPHTEVFIEGRSIFGFMGFALLNRWWTALLLACLLSITGFHKLPLGIVFIGNMMYMLPILVVIRTVYKHFLNRLRSLTWYGAAWLLMILLCYQIFTTPAIWGFMAFLQDAPIWPGVLDGWRQQPFLVESLLVGVISAMAMMVIRSNAALRASWQELTITLYSIGDGVIATDADGRVRRMNPVAENLTGWSEAEAAGKQLDVVFDIINEETRCPVENPVAQILREREVVGLANHTLLIARDGREIPIADSGAPIFDPQGNVAGVVLVFRDQAEERLARRLIETRLSLIQYAASQPLKEFLTRALDEVGAFVDSPIGFYHLVGPDEKTLALQQWSTRTLQEYCQAEGERKHYSIDQAGVWVDCVHKRKPVIHNDYASLPHQKGMPDGHVDLRRELVVPVIRDDKVVGILGVGNKPTNYTPKDTEIVSYFADVTWEIVQQKQAQKALRKSEEQYGTLMHRIQAAVVVHDADTRIIASNPKAQDLLGLTEDQMMGRTAMDPNWKFLDADGERMPLEQYPVNRVLDTQQPLRDLTVGVYRPRKADRVWVLINADPVFDDRGEIEQVIVTFVDITQRKQMAEERERLAAHVREQAQQMEQILATVPAGVLLVDAQERILQANPTATKTLAILNEAKVGDTLTHLGDHPLNELLTSPPTKGLWHEVKAGKRTFEVIARPVEPALARDPRQSTEAGSPDGSAPQPEHWVLVTNDVTREREIQAQLQQQERLAAVGQLAAGIAHDFNNIMASIVLYAQMAARSEALSDRDRERLAVIDQQAWHATRLIEQILDFSRQAVLERRALDLLPLIKEQIKLLERTLPEHIGIELHHGPDEYTVHADPTRIQQMLTNLAVNARDAMPQGGSLHVGLERVTIEQAASLPLVEPDTETGEWIRLTVSDTGTGIPPDVLPHIFEPFFTTKAPGQGSGLGLAQVHGIVGQHGGHIDVDTQVNEGTTFAVYLPALSLHPAETARPDASALLRGQGQVVMVVEDGDTVRAALVDSLEQLNYRTLAAGNGYQALALMEKQGEQIALILSDVVMPGMGGIPLFHALRQKGWQTPVILLTGHPMEKELQALRAQGLSTWLPKPPSLERLAQAVDEALRDTALQ